MAVQKINSDVDRLLEWAHLNRLILNTDKTQAIIMGTVRHINALGLERMPNVMIGDTLIAYAERVRYLGFTLSSTLSWEAQVTRTVGRVHSTLYQLKLCKKLLSRDLRRRLVISLVLPFLDYCCAALTDISQERNLRLQRALNACVRFIFDVRSDEHISPYFEQFGWLKIDMRRNYLVMCLLYKVLHTGHPSVLSCNLTFRASISSRVTRAATDMLELPQCHTETFRKSFRCVASAV